MKFHPTPVNTVKFLMARWHPGKRVPLYYILSCFFFLFLVFFFHSSTTVMVTNYAKCRVKLRIERAKFQFVLIIFFAIEQCYCSTFSLKKKMDSDKSYHSDVICWHVDETMCKIKTWLFQFFLVVSPTF